MRTYRTSEVAKLIGIHPNTVRLYEEWKLIPPPERGQNGYRIFTDFHIAQFRLARTALQVEVLQNGLRKRAVEIVKMSAKGDLAGAIRLTERYLQDIRRERRNAEEAIGCAGQILNGETEGPPRRRKETADALHVSMDTLRNWEMNGLLTVKRRQNGYRVYTPSDLDRLTVIRSLRCANYSLAAILRMLGALSHDPETDLRKAIDTPHETDDVITACDRLITSLELAEENAGLLKAQLLKMKQKLDNPPL